MTMWSLLSGFIGGVLAWIATTVIGQPMQRFFQLRQQAALVLAKFDDRPWIGNPEAKPPDEDWRKERSEAFDKVGSELVAFADANAFIARALHHNILGRNRFYVRSAGENLRTLGKAYPGTQAWDQLRRETQRGLKIVGGS